MDKRPISPTQAEKLLREIEKKRDVFAPHTVPWYRYEEILTLVRAAQNGTERPT